MSWIIMALVARRGRAARRPRRGHAGIDGADTSFTWRAVERDAERLLAGARLLAILAGGPALGAYR